ncbi:hypothetical protein F441_13151 [Phytophthora nicotianae CJ01A1]|uniref:Uncharacterized protein n=2 Tax=Phytophthora nicotianae TaxID=4792 RepID=W2WMF1_PHYNI|nr:hypothetical protein L917_12641 [Phytophthora nicotianae]ETP11323.1 hypothetical protein F441_13151 [Phytophthora nicotianae CJ01A1]
MLVELVLELVRLKLCEPAKPRLSRRRRLAVHHCNSPLSSWRKLYCNHCQPLLTQILQDGYGAYSNRKVFLEKGAWWTASPFERRLSNRAVQEGPPTGPRRSAIHQTIEADAGLGDHFQDLSDALGTISWSNIGECTLYLHVLNSCHTETK